MVSAVVAPMVSNKAIRISLNTDLDLRFKDITPPVSYRLVDKPHSMNKLMGVS